MPQTDLDLLGLPDLLDLQDLRQLLDALCAVTGTRAALRGRTGESLLLPTNPDVRRIEGAAEGRTIALAVPDPESSQPFGTLELEARRGIGADALRIFRLIAATIGRLAAEEREAKRRLAELTAVYNTSMMLAEARDLGTLLNRSARLIVEVMGAKGASIRLIDESLDELRIAAAYGLSDYYLDKGPLRLSKAGIDHVALSNGYEQVPDLRTDSRVQFPEMAAREGIVSMLSVAMRYKGQAVGVLRAYTDREHHFGVTEVELLRAIAAQAAAAIANARLAQETAEAEALEQQIETAADVQQRMIPSEPPPSNCFEFATVYVPCFELAGDLFDFIPLGDERYGIVIADVAGKGVPASLIMATVRAYLRASSEHVDDPQETVQRLNTMLCRDNRPGEFVSLIWGVLDGPARRFDYVMAGHPAPILARGDAIIGLPDLQPLGRDMGGGPSSIGTRGGDIVLGVLPDATFRVHRLDLEPEDRLLFYTDGLSEARDFADRLFGDGRIVASLAASIDRRSARIEEHVQNVLWDMRRFVGLQQRSDDITILGVEVLAACGATADESTNAPADA